MIFGCDKADGITNGLSAPSASDPVHVIFCVHRKVKIHDVRDSIHIDTPSRDISRHQDADLARLEVFQSTDALILGAIGMQRSAFDTQTFQTTGDSICTVFSPCKHENTVHRRVLQQMG